MAVNNVACYALIICSYTTCHMPCLCSSGVFRRWKDHLGSILEFVGNVLAKLQSNKLLDLLHGDAHLVFEYMAFEFFT